MSPKSTWYPSPNKRNKNLLQRGWFYSSRNCPLMYTERITTTICIKKVWVLQWHTFLMLQEYPTFIYRVFQHGFVQVVLCWAAIEWQRQFLSFLFLARSAKHFHEITLVSNKSATRIMVLSMVVNWGGPECKDDLYLMYHDGNLKWYLADIFFLQVLLHGICCKSSST